LLLFTFFMASCSRDPKVQARRYVENGNKFYEKSKFKEASIMYRRALQKDLRFGDAYYRLALADIKLAAFGDAVRAFRRAVELEPDNTDAAIKLSDILLVAINQDRDHGEDLMKEVKQLADKILQKDSNSYDGHRIEGQLALLQKDAPGAVKQFELATRAKPGQTDLSLAYFQALLSNQQAPEAEKMGLAVIDKNKNFSPMYDVLYVYYMQNKRVPDAERILQRKVENNPQQGNYLVELAAHYLFTKQNSFRKAICWQAISCISERATSIGPARSMRLGRKRRRAISWCTRNAWSSCSPPPGATRMPTSCLPPSLKSRPTIAMPWRCGPP
jgi:tetratricopeptide (TPR) repeat protein